MHLAILSLRLIIDGADWGFPPLQSPGGFQVANLVVEAAHCPLEVSSARSFSARTQPLSPNQHQVGRGCPPLVPNQ